jgi:hypothetical protein
MIPGWNYYKLKIMGKNKVDGPFEGLKKLSDQKKVAKYKISSIFLSPTTRKSPIKKASLQLAAMFRVTFLLILILLLDSITQTFSASGTHTAAFSASPTSV